jgi:transcriptional regulator with XRE-family HTH domain
VGLLQRAVRAFVGKTMRERVLSQGQVATMMGTSRPQVSQYLHAKNNRTIDLAHLEGFANGVGATVIGMVHEIALIASKLGDEASDDEKFVGDAKPGRPAKNRVGAAIERPRATEAAAELARFAEPRAAASRDAVLPSKAKRAGTRSKL